jgi:UDP-N-acetylglucosamine 3-dehydrogenase
VRVLLIGLGRWGERHLRVLREIGAQVWVSDISEARRRRAREAGLDGLRCVADPTEVLDGVEAVDVVTPADTHLALASQALQAGKPCFVEKPLALTVSEGIKLARIAEETRMLLQVGHVFRFHPVTDVLREHLAAGTVGTVRYCTARFAGFKRPRPDVGVTQTDALHFFDLFTYLLDAVPTAVTATVGDHLKRGLDDCSFTVIEYGPTAAMIEAGYFTPGVHRECAIIGDRGTLTADFVASEVRVHRSYHRRGTAGWEAVAGPVEVIRAGGPEPLRRELERFIDAARRGDPSPVCARAGLVTLRIAEAAQRSSALGRRVLLDEASGGRAEPRFDGGAEGVWCRRGDSNPHTLAGT